MCDDVNMLEEIENWMLKLNTLYKILWVEVLDTGEVALCVTQDDCVDGGGSIYRVIMPQTPIHYSFCERCYTDSDCSECEGETEIDVLQGQFLKDSLGYLNINSADSNATLQILPDVIGLIGTYVVIITSGNITIELDIQKPLSVTEV